jgi:uncharacterized protein (TIGR03435 family)
MFKTLLVDSFKLAFHQGTKKGVIYALLSEKGEPWATMSAWSLSPHPELFSLERMRQASAGRLSPVLNQLERGTAERRQHLRERF